LTFRRAQIRFGEKRRLPLRRSVAGDLDPAELEMVVIDADLPSQLGSDIRIDLPFRRATTAPALDVGSETGPAGFAIDLPFACERLFEESPFRVRDDVNDELASRGCLPEQCDRRRKRLSILRGGDSKAGVIVLNFCESLQPLLIGLCRQQRQEVEDRLLFHYAGRHAGLRVAANDATYQIGRPSDESATDERQSVGGAEVA